MSVIQILDLTHNSANLFDDPESYLDELSNESLTLSEIQGGATPALGCVVSIVSFVAFAAAGAAIGAAVSNAIRQ